MLYVGVDVGGMSVKAGVCTESGEILIKSSCPTGVERGHEATISDMADLVLRIIAESGHTLSDVAAIGIGIPGIEDPATELVPLCNNLFWRDVPLRRLFTERIHKPLFIDNDATVAALAESVAGASAGTRMSVFITLGTGVGGGIIIDGKVFTGAHGVGSEIGHMVTVAGGEPCNCGHCGCWEKYTSAVALMRMGKNAMLNEPEGAIAHAAGFDTANVTAKLVIDLAKAGDDACAAIFKEYVKHICIGLANLINVLDPDVFVLGGGVAYAGEFLLNAVREELPKHVFLPDMPYARVELATLGNDAGIIGAAMLGR